MSSVTDQITNAATSTAQMQAAQNKPTGSASSNLSSSDFLNLMMQQLQYQDPMSPTDNTQFVSQECQFAQLSQATDTNTALASSQALNLVGKNVTITDPNDSSKTISGTVTSATVDGTSSTIKLNGTEYPVSDLQSVNTSTTTGATTTTGTTTTTNQ